MGVTTARDIRNLALIGFMGTGKTTIGHLMAAQLHFQFVDTDHLIEVTAGKNIAEIFASAGEAAFRELEQKVVQELAGRTATIIATGGGLACFNDNLASIKAHALVVCLWATPEAIFERVRHHAHRPLLCAPDPLAKIRELLAAREPYYRQADVLISTEGRSSRDIAQHLIHEFSRMRASHRKDAPG